MTQQDMIKLVWDLNTAIEQLMGVFPGYSFEFRTTGNVDAIFLNDILLYDSENDERKFDEESGDYEDMREFLKRKIAEELIQMKKIGKLL